MLFSTELLQLLQRAKFDPSATRGFDAFAGGFRWSDEFPPEFIEESLRHNDWTHRSLRAYRSAIICGDKDNTDQAVWEQVTAKFSEWPGFRAERCDCSLAEELLAEKRRVLAELESLFDTPI